MSDQAQTAAIVVALIALMFLGLWISLIVFGVKVAKEKHRSPHWMWFGVHPVGALIVFLVMTCLDPLKLCPQCARPSPPQARVCPYCTYSFLPPARRAARGMTS